MSERKSISELEKELRASWDAQGIPKERQDNVLRQIAVAAQPGAWVGPFQIPDKIKS